MRRLLAVLSVLAGALLVAVGVAAAVVIGPDNWVSPRAGLNATGVVETAPALFAVRDARLRVTASNDGGTVFVGVASPVDAASYLDGVRRVRVDSVSPQQVAGETVAGERRAPAVAPQRATFWSDSASGSGGQSLELDPDGHAFTVVVVPTAPGQATSLTVALYLPGGFAVALGVAGLGVALVLGTVVRTARRRRTRLPAVLPGPSVTTGARGHGSALVARRVGTRLRARAGVAAVLACAALAGCVPLPSAVDVEQHPVRKAVLAQEVEPAMRSYDARNNAVIAQLHDSFDASGWPKVDSGPVLLVDELDAAYSKAAHDRGDATPITVTAQTVHAPEFDAYPMWFMATGTATSARVPAKKGSRDLFVFERDSAVAPWLMRIHSRIPTADAPAAAANATATAPQRKAAQRAVDALTSALTRRRSNSLTKGTGVDRFLRSVDQTETSGGYPLDLEVTGPGPVDDDPYRARPEVHVVAVEGGGLTTITFGYRERTSGGPGVALFLPDKAMAKATDQTGDLSQVVLHGILTVVVGLPDDGPARVLSAHWEATLR